MSTSKWGFFEGCPKCCSCKGLRRLQNGAGACRASPGHGNAPPVRQDRRRATSPRPPSARLDQGSRAPRRTGSPTGIGSGRAWEPASAGLGAEAVPRRVGRASPRRSCSLGGGWAGVGRGGTGGSSQPPLTYTPSDFCVRIGEGPHEGPSPPHLALGVQSQNMFKQFTTPAGLVTVFRHGLLWS